MSKTKRVDDFIRSFENLSEDEKKEAMKRIMSEFCETAMKDKEFIQEMMPKCMEMMKGMNFPLKEMMSKMMNVDRK